MIVLLLLANLNLLYAVVLDSSATYFNSQGTGPGVVMCVYNNG